MYVRTSASANTVSVSLLVAVGMPVARYPRTDTFRHTYNSLLAESGNDVRVVQKLMQHAKVNTPIELYTLAQEAGGAEPYRGPAVLAGTRKEAAAMKRGESFVPRLCPFSGGQST
jgi:integrase